MHQTGVEKYHQDSALRASVLSWSPKQIITQKTETNHGCHRYRTANQLAEQVSLRISFDLMKPGEVGAGGLHCTDFFFAFLSWQSLWGMWYHVAIATVCIDEASHTVGHLIYVQMPSSVLEKLAQGDLASLHMQRAAQLKQHPGEGALPCRYPGVRQHCCLRSPLGVRRNPSPRCREMGSMCLVFSTLRFPDSF